MTWRDRFNPRGSFRGVEFVIDRDDAEIGRRAQLHEYPLRDKPYVEDLGRRARQFSVELVTIGPDYDLQRDRLMRALERPGPGTLIHPRYGTMRASVLDVRVRESTREQGVARCSVTFAESGELQFPSRQPATATRVAEAADQTLAEAIEDFAATFSVVGQAADLVAETEEELDRVLSAVVAVTGAATGPIASLIRAPANMASAIAGAVGEIGNAIDEPARALEIYTRSFNAGVDSPSVPGVTAQRRQQQRNTTALHWLVRRAAIAEAAISFSEGNTGAGKPAWPTREAALAARDAVLDGIDDHTRAVDRDGAPIADAVYGRLTRLRADVVADARIRAAQLPRLQTFTPQATQPALAIAQRLYADARRADEIVDRNPVRHPLFVTGGEPLEVLSDA